MSLIIEHIGFNTDEPELMVNWYCNNFGMKIVRENKEGRTYFISDAEGNILEIYNNPDYKSLDFAAMNPFHLHFAFSSDNIEEDVKKLTDAGAVIQTTPYIGPTGDQFAMLKDPWGISIQLVKRKVAMK